MHLRQGFFINLAAVFRKNAAQDIGSPLGCAPVLVTDDVGKALEEGDRGVGIEQPALETTTVTAMQIFGDKDAAMLYKRKIQGERLDDVA